MRAGAFSCACCAPKGITMSRYSVFTLEVDGEFNPTSVGEMPPHFLGGTIHTKDVSYTHASTITRGYNFDRINDQGDGSWMILAMAGRHKIRLTMLGLFPFCQWCATPLTVETATIDHIKPRARYGDGGLLNRALACLDCNQQKADHDWGRPRFGPSEWGLLLHC